MQTLKELRVARREGQNEVARALDVTVNTVSRWERGRLPPAKYRRQLAKYFGVEQSDIAWPEQDVAS